MEINSDFATEALLEFHYVGGPRGGNPSANISIVITDEEDIAMLKDILRGRPFRESFHCSFSTDISITMTNGSRSIMFIPACDGCPFLRIGDTGAGNTNKYIRISYENRDRLHEIFERYGGFFPCI